MSKKLYYIFNKPFNVLSQFTKEVPEHITLQDFLTVPKDVYPVGRLDKDSEGLLILTNDNQFKTKLLDPKFRNQKTYWVQVEGLVSDEAIAQLSQGVSIKIKNGFYPTLPADVKKINAPNVENRNPPVRYRASIPTSWMEITIHEGKNRQIRKMCAKVGFPCLRLIRCQIKRLSFADVPIGTFRPLTNTELNYLSK
ncbi:MAG: pseudouridine synthase [Saprospiraceae bacterium]|nr:pseudouridine synthase [Saprospiraceae bacterium]